MDEFIVWDKVHNQFLDSDMIEGIAFKNSKVHYLVDNRTPKLEYSNLFNEEVDFFYGIGLKDINKKKIYADCSIVEFEFYNSANKWEKIVGYFKYIPECFCYIIIALSCGYSTIPISTLGNKNFKIIDTIQENKLGLIK